MKENSTYNLGVTFVVLSIVSIGYSNIVLTKFIGSTVTSPKQSWTEEKSAQKTRQVVNSPTLQTP